jgi:pilus assembly protein Flp/PilA
MGSCRWDYTGPTIRSGIRKNLPVNRHLVKSANDQVTVSGDRGAALVEYLLLVALIAVVCLAAVTILGEGASDSLTNTASTVDSSSGG